MKVTSLYSSIQHAKRSRSVEITLQHFLLDMMICLKLWRLNLTVLDTFFT